MNEEFQIIRPDTIDPKKIRTWETLLCIVSTNSAPRTAMVSGDGIPDETIRIEPAPLQKDCPPDTLPRYRLESTQTISQLLKNKDRLDLVLKIAFSDGKETHYQISLVGYSWTVQKQNRRNRFFSMLVCPNCQIPLDSKDGPDTLTCPQCATHYPFNGNGYDFLTDQLRKEFKIVSTKNVSDHPLPADIQCLAQSNPQKLFLDCGAGFKYDCLDNVVNLEIVNYPSTDVISAGERIPFADNSFDGVFSLAVLEHVKNPFVCAQELTRVLKKGGVLICTVPFLQPVHGYPNHYYNMTHQGLINLFPDLKLIEYTIPPGSQPMTAITWILGSYSNGLPQPHRDSFLEMKVSDVINFFGGKKNYHDPIVTTLETQTKIGLACSNRICALKT